MFAIFRTGGKQFRAEPGAILRVPALQAEAGSTVTFEDVLLASEGGQASIGAPRLHGATVTAEVLSHDRTKKIVVFKRKRRKGFRRKKGHRQRYTVVRVGDIAV